MCSNCCFLLLIESQNDPLQEPDFFQVSKLFTVRDLLNANVHLGHHEGCWNPFMKPYLFGSRERFHIIDLDKTTTHLKVEIFSSTPSTKHQITSGQTTRSVNHY